METNELIIKISKFHMRMAKYALIPRFIYNVDRIVGMKDIILDHRMSGFKEQFNEILVRGVFSTEAGSPDLKIWREKLEQNTREDIEEYLPILFNQALIMMCTTFDIFLVDSLEVIIRKQRTVLHRLADPKDISITQVIDAPDYETIFETILNRALKRFDYGGIEDKVKVLKKIDLNTDGVFNFKFQGDDTRNQFPNSYDKLVSIYNDRHGIVHRDNLPIKTPDELEPIAELFGNLILNFGWEIGERFNIPTDFDLQKLIKKMLPPP